MTEIIAAYIAEKSVLKRVNKRASSVGVMLFIALLCILVHSNQMLPKLAKAIVTQV